MPKLSFAVWLYFLVLCLENNDVVPSMRLSSGLSVSIGILAFLAASYLLSLDDYRGRQKYKEWRFVREVLLYSKSGKRMERLTRWTLSPKIDFASNNEKDQALFNDVVSELNAVLAGTGYQLIVGYPGPWAPNILAMVGKESLIPEIAGIMGCEGQGDARGYLCIRFREDRSLKRAAVWASEDYDQEEIRSILLEEIFQALGPSNDSAIYQDSLLFETEDYAPMYKTLSPRDKKLLRFLYTHLKPGDEEEEVRKAFDQHWDKMDVR